MATAKLKFDEVRLMDGGFTRSQVRALAHHVKLELDPGDEIVHIGQNPPIDTGKRWQQTDGTGALVGQLKTYQKGEWK